MEKEQLKAWIENGGKAIATYMGYAYYPFNEAEKKEGYRFGWIKPESRGKISEETKLAGNRVLARKTQDLRYFNEWNWIMPVFLKIAREVQYFTIAKDPHNSDHGRVWVKTAGYESTYIVTPEELRVSHGQDHRKLIHALFAAVVDYIEWKNRQKK